MSRYKCQHTGQDQWEICDVLDYLNSGKIKSQYDLWKHVDDCLFKASLTRYPMVKRERLTTWANWIVSVLARGGKDMFDKYTP